MQEEDDAGKGRRRKRTTQEEDAAGRESTTRRFSAASSFQSKDGMESLRAKTCARTFSLAQLREKNPNNSQAPPRAPCDSELHVILSCNVILSCM